MALNTLEYGAYTLEIARNEFDCDKDKISFIKNCVKLARQTPEYKDWVRYVKEMLGYRTCSITGEISGQVTVEIHHHPMTIFEITTIIVDTYIKCKKKFTSLNIVNDVMTLHYNDKIGFIPLCITLHEKYHNGYAVIPPKFIVGDWKYLLTTNGYEVDPEIAKRSYELMADSNNAYDNETTKWINVNTGGIIQDE